jgi:hypothetical protein
VASTKTSWRLPKALIEGHPETNLLARIFIETGRFPNEVYNLPRGERALVYASMITGGKYKGGSGAAASAKNVKTMLARVRTAKGLPSGGT